MKKIIMPLLMITCLLLLPINVYAINKAVTIAASSATTSSVTVSGTTEAIAVVVQVRDTDDITILAMESFPVINGEFSATIDSGLNLSSSNTYKVYVADFEGGDWATTEVVPINNGGSNGGGNGGSGSGNNGTSGNTNTDTPSGDTAAPTGDNGSSDGNSTDDNAGNGTDGDLDEVSPKTGDDAHVGSYLMLIVAGTVLAGTSIYSNKKKVK